MNDIDGIGDDAKRMIAESRSKSLGDAFPLELSRVRELLDLYKALPLQSGWFGVQVLADLITRAEIAKSAGDVVEMVRIYAEMREAE